MNSLIFVAFSGATAAAFGAEVAAFCCDVDGPSFVSPVLGAGPAGGAALFAAGDVLVGVLGGVEGLVSALSFAGADGAGWVAPDLVGASLVSLDAFAGGDFSGGGEVVDFTGSLDSEPAFGVPVFSEEGLDGVSEAFDSLAAFGGSAFSGSLASEAALGGADR